MLRGSRSRALNPFYPCPLVSFTLTKQNALSKILKSRSEFRFDQAFERNESEHHMKHPSIVPWLLISLLLIAFAGGEISVKSASPPRRPPIDDPVAQKRSLPPAFPARRRTIDVKHIALDLRFDWAKKQAYGTAAITFAPLAPSDKISLDAGLLTISAITLTNGAPLKFIYDGGDRNDGLEISLDRRYQPNEELAVRIAYRTDWVNQSDPNSLGGSAGKGLRFLGPTATDPSKRRQIWSMGEPEGNQYWFPGYDAPDDLRTTEFSATVDAGLTAISNGRLVKTKTNPDGTRTFRWSQGQPYANHLTSVVIGEYVDVKQSYDGIELHSFSYPDEVAATEATVVRLPDMVRYFSRVTGMKYPYPRYSQVFVQDHPGFMGHAAASTITENMVDDDRTHDDFYYLWDLTEAESLAQQWFGVSISARDWSHAWLNKSLAHYLNGLYNEQKNGHDEFQLYQVTWDHDVVYLNDWRSGVRRPIVTPNFTDPTAMASDNYAFTRGGLVLRLLRHELGNEKWWRGIRQYVRTHAGRSVTTDDLRVAFETAAGEKLDWFFDQWIYRMGHPVFVVTKTYDAAKKQLIVNVKQTQQVDPNEGYPQTALFQGKLDIAIDGRIETVRLEAKPENIFSFTATSEPKLISFDHESNWIKEVTFEKTLPELLYQFEHDRDIIGRRSAMLEMVKIAKLEGTRAAARSAIHAAFRQMIGSNANWRLRWQALGQLQGLLVPAGSTSGVSLDEVTAKLLLQIIERDRAWVRASAINFLGMTRDARYAPIYLRYFEDPSDRVINAAANALGRSRDPRAFDALVKLSSKPSWKNQSLISALNGLQQLNDPRGYDLAWKALSDLRSPHWTLATPVWDYRLTAAVTIAALGKSETAYPGVLAGLKRALAEDDLHGAFYQALLITTLADPRGQEGFDLLRAKYQSNPYTLQAVEQYESQFKDAVKQR